MTLVTVRCSPHPICLPRYTHHPDCPVIPIHIPDKWGSIFIKAPNLGRVWGDPILYIPPTTKVLWYTRQEIKLKEPHPTRILMSSLTTGNSYTIIKITYMDIKFTWSKKPAPEPTLRTVPLVVPLGVEPFSYYTSKNRLSPWSRSAAPRIPSASPTTHTTPTAQ